MGSPYTDENMVALSISFVVLDVPHLFWVQLSYCEEATHCSEKHVVVMNISSLSWVYSGDVGVVQPIQDLGHHGNLHGGSENVFSSSAHTEADKILWSWNFMIISGAPVTMEHKQVVFTNPR